MAENCERKGTITRSGHSLSLNNVFGKAEADWYSSERLA